MAKPGHNKQEQKYKRILTTKSWEYLCNNYHKLSQTNKVRIALILLSRYRKPKELTCIGNREPTYKWRAAVLTRDNFTCQHCGLIGCILEAHHIKSWRDYPDLRFEVENGTTLCVKCHQKVHKNRMSEFSELDIMAQVSTN
uniref:Putative homing endonuclease n=1 Tax=viral metagenome TaxID=1070528 RepID=A0A6M3JYR4_9ZZZZ